MNTKTETPVLPPLAGIEKLTSVFADDYNGVRAIVADWQNEIETIKEKYLTALRRAVKRARDSREELRAAIAAAPELFESPRTFVFHGVKVGFAKGKGRLEIPDEDFTVGRIMELLDEPENFIRVVESPNKEALVGLPADTLKKLGVKIVNTEDSVVITPMDGSVDRFVAAMLKDDGA